MIFSASCSSVLFIFFFFNDTATTEIYTLSLHDALPISKEEVRVLARRAGLSVADKPDSQELCFVPTGNYVRFIEAYSRESGLEDRKSTRLNSSHLVISYAVFCLKKKKKQKEETDASSTS